MVKSIDLFAGIGGIRLGFDNAFGKDIETVFVSEWDEFAQKTYKSNFDDPFDIAGDITKIDEKDIPAFDICLAGFPCQAFSIAGTGGAIKLRFTSSKSKKGKSGSERAIYCAFDVNGNIREYNFILCYTKNSKETLTSKEKKALKDVVKELKKNRPN